MSNKRKRSLLILLGAFIIIAVILLLIATIGKEKKEVVKVGFIMSGSVTEQGWNGKHYEGVKAACESLGVELVVKENVKEFSDECETAIAELAKEQVGMIILSSYNYSEEVKDVVKDYPEIVFYANSSEHHDENMTSYFVRMYQARYMAGIVAGSKTETGVIGYVAAMNNNEVNRGISAFTLGVKKANPEAKVVVNWTGVWDNAEMEKQCAEQLITECNADVLAYHQNQPNVVYKAEEMGVFSIGYHEAVEGVSSKYLMSVVCDWEKVYKEIIRSFLAGTANEKENYWIGLEADAVGLSPYSAEVPEKVRKNVEQAREEILSGREIFSGKILDNQGNVRCGEKEMISDERLLEQFDWFVEGVEIYED